uniref:Uncharacterized protein n=1 Tax=Romanomermis culicivorax TaxID=13658 RepID=A0A915I1C1_ROMCU
MFIQLDGVSEDYRFWSKKLQMNCAIADVKKTEIAQYKLNPAVSYIIRIGCGSYTNQGYDILSNSSSYLLMGLQVA